LNEMRTISNPLAVETSDRRVERLFRTINLQTSFSPVMNTAPTASSFLSKAGNEKLICQDLVLGCGHHYDFNIYHLCTLPPSPVVDEVWKQQTLLQLLLIIELPVLDCILTSPERVRPRACRAPLANYDLVISNTCLERNLPDTLSLLESVPHQMLKHGPF
ncbi:hypothetical protein GOODEAATRI_003818, partial [Goodea atripinnis]